MKITMYELLGMVKDGKAPKKVKYINSIWEYDKETKDYFHDDLWLIYSMNSIGLTESKIEILEEKKIPEKIFHCYTKTDNEEIEFLIKNINNLADRYNQLIDYLRSKGE